ncbi:MAG: DUF2207 family protein [Actinomycetota bacterium]
MSKFRRAALATVSAGVILLSTPSAGARSYRFRSIYITAQVARDGSMLITEERRVRFDGSFRGMFRDIGLSPERERFGGYTVTLQKVFDDGTPLTRVPRAQLRPGTFTSYGYQDSQRFEWQYQATDQTKTFRLVYRIEGHVKRYRDIAELWWTFIEADRSGVGVDDARVTILLPAAAQPRAWGHGTLSGEVTIAGPKRVEFHVPGLGDGEELGARVAFDASVVPGARFIDETRLRTILLEEEAAANRANSARWRVRLWNIIPLIAAIAWLLYWLRLFGRYGREHQTQAPEYLRELPAGYPPAIVGWLMRWGDVKPEDMTATIMDLARRGFVTIHETTREKGLIFKREVADVAIEATAKTTEHLLPYEKHVLQLLGRVREDRGRVTTHELKEWAEEDPSRMKREFSNFEAEVRAHGRTLNLIEDRTQTIAVSVVGVAALGGIVALAISRIAQDGRDLISGGPFILVAAALGLVTLAGTPFMTQRSRIGAQHKANWEAFRRYLTDFGRLHEKSPGAVVLWEEYLVYAIPLGVAEEVIETMKVHLPEDALTQGSAFAWYTPVGAHGWTNLDTFGDAMGTLHQSIGITASQAFATAPSSGSGGGGGFSGGGGGGGGGGGSSGAY